MRVTSATLRSIARVLFALGLLSVSPRSVQAAEYRLQVSNASAEDTALALQQTLGYRVLLSGGERQKLSLELNASTAPLLLNQLAATTGGTWKMKLRVLPGPPQPPKLEAQPDRPLTLGLRDLSAARAFQIVARELRAELELPTLPEVQVSLLVANQPAHLVLDRIAQEANVSWELIYLLELPDAPPEAVVIPAVPRPEPPRPQQPERSTLPPSTAPQENAPQEKPVPDLPSVALTPPVLEAPTGPALRARLWNSLNDVVRISPDRRAEMMQTFLREGEALIRSLDSLEQPERNARLRAAQSILVPWRQLYRGLAPTVQQELLPVKEFLEQHLRP